MSSEFDYHNAEEKFRLGQARRLVACYQEATDGPPRRRRRCRTGSPPTLTGSHVMSWARRCPWQRTSESSSRSGPSWWSARRREAGRKASLIPPVLCLARAAEIRAQDGCADCWRSSRMSIQMPTPARATIPVTGASTMLSSNAIAKVTTRVTISHQNRKPR